MSLPKLLFSIYDERLRGRPMLRYLREYERQQWLPLTTIRDLQLTKLRRLLAHAAATVPHFRNLAASRGDLAARLTTLDGLADLPIMTKQWIRDRYADFVSETEGHANVRKSTGGSTGDPFQFQYNRDSEYRRLATMWRGYRWGGADIGCRSAFIWSWPFAGKRGWSLAREQLYQRILGRHYFNIFELSDDNLPEVARRLAELRPQVIVTYVSGGLTLARWMIENRFSFPAPRAVITGAEALHEPERETLRKAFGAPVFNTYGGREFMLLASECEHHCGLHVNADHLILETVDEQGRPVVGQPGRVLITDLHNYGMPFVRYENGDVAVIDPRPCDCGRGLPLLKYVEGRVADVIRLPDGRRLTGLYFVHMFKDLHLARFYKITQLRRDALLIQIVPMRSEATGLVDQVKAMLAPELGPAVAVTVELVKDIPLTRMGKRRIVESRVDA
jgi:phenylacetate-CoA ligase